MEPPSAVVVGTRFGLYTADEIAASSNVEINDTRVYKNGIVARHGVNDPGLGTTNSNLLCSTCFSTMEHCPGHIGYIALRQPVVNVEFSSYLLKILTSVCMWCCRLLLPVDHPRYPEILALPDSEQRLKEIYTFAKCFRVCQHWNEGGSADQPCGRTQPVLYFKGALLRTDTVCGLTMQDVYTVLDTLSDDTVRILGLDPQHSPPAGMMWRNLIVPPVGIRPPRIISNNAKICGEDDLTLWLRDIVKLNRTIPETERMELSSKMDDPAYASYADLQHAVATYQDLRYLTKGREGIHRYGGERKCLRKRFTGGDNSRGTNKNGRMRNTVYSKRTDYCGRTVITPDLDIKVWELGVPLWMCSLLTYPEIVTKHNIHWLTSLVRNGPHVYPGANYVVDGKRNVYLDVADRYSIELKYGQTVRRHMIKGDWVMFNRQPTLHKMSIMAHQIVPQKGNTFRLNVACTPSYNADFDGDEMNLALQVSTATRAEAQELMSVQKNVVKDGRVLIAFQQNAALAAWLLTADDVLLSRDTVQQLLMANEYAQPLSDSSKFTGRQAFSLCLPPDLHFWRGDVNIEHGQLLSGRLTKSVLNQGVVHTLWKEFGGDFAVEFVSGTQLFLCAYLEWRGCTIGLTDCIVAVSQQSLGRYDASRMYTAQAQGPSKTKERNIILVNDRLRDLTGDEVVNTLETRGENGLVQIVRSGAKGNLTNLVQCCGLLGQQRTHRGTRILESTNHTVNAAVAGGMIYNSFASGLDPIECYNHLRCSRTGLVDTAIKTAETGYCQRRLGKAMEDVVVHHNGLVRDNGRHLVQFLYGNHGFDPDKIEVQDIRFVHWSTEKIQTFYGVAAPRVLELRNQFLKLVNPKPLETTSHCPVPFERLLRSAELLRTAPLCLKAEAERQCAAFFRKLVADNVAVLTLRTEALVLDYVNAEELIERRKLDLATLERTLALVYHYLITGAITPFECVGNIASQNCGEPMMQMTLNTFHSSGLASTVVSGIVRIDEILNLKEKQQARSMTVFVLPTHDAVKVGEEIVHVAAEDMVQRWSLTVPEPGRNTLFMSWWNFWQDKTADYTLVLHLNKTKCLAKRVAPVQVAEAVVLHHTGVYYMVSFSPLDAEEWWIAINLAKDDTLWTMAKGELSKSRENVTDHSVLLYLYRYLLFDVLIRGCRNIKNYVVQNMQLRPDEPARQILLTDGSNLLEVLEKPGVDVSLTTSNDISEMYSMFGVDAGVSAVFTELKNVMLSNRADVNACHIGLIADQMGIRGVISPMTRTGICRHDDISVLKQMSYEKPMEQAVNSAIRGQLDDMTNTMDSIAWYSTFKFGTDSVHLVKSDTTQLDLSPDISFMHRELPYCPKPDITKYLQPGVLDLPFLERKRRQKTEPVAVLASKKIRTAEPSGSVGTFTTQGGLFVPSSPVVSSLPLNFFTADNEHFLPTSPL